MNLSHRLYLLDGTFPEKVEIEPNKNLKDLIKNNILDAKKSNKKNEHYFNSKNKDNQYLDSNNSLLKNNFSANDIDNNIYISSKINIENLNTINKDTSKNNLELENKNLTIDTNDKIKTNTQISNLEINSLNKIMLSFFDTKKIINYNCFDDFKNDIEFLLCLCKYGYKVTLYINQEKCQMLCYTSFYSCWSTFRYLTLNNFQDISFYTKDKDLDKTIFKDLFEEYLTKDNDLIRYSLTNISYFKYEKNIEYKSNFDIKSLGKSLFEFALKDSVFNITNESLIPSELLCKDILTEKELVEIIAKKYSLWEHILYNKNDKTILTDYVFRSTNDKGNGILVDAIYSMFFAIFELTNNFNNIREIIRNFIFITKPFSNENNAENEYKNLSNYITKKQLNSGDYLTFEEIEKVINKKINSNFLYFTYMLEKYGYYIQKFDFENKLVYIGIVY